MSSLFHVANDYKIIKIQTSLDSTLKNFPHWWLGASVALKKLKHDPLKLRYYFSVER